MNSNSADQRKKVPRIRDKYLESHRVGCRRRYGVAAGVAITAITAGNSHFPAGISSSTAGNYNFPAGNLHNCDGIVISTAGNCSFPAGNLHNCDNIVISTAENYSFPAGNLHNCDGIVISTAGNSCFFAMDHPFCPGWIALSSSFVSPRHCSAGTGCVVHIQILKSSIDNVPKRQPTHTGVARASRGHHQGAEGRTSRCRAGLPSASARRRDDA
jgi:hypothetical protein